jgi:hypothetical protein
MLLRGATIDYRCEDGRFPVSASFVTLLNLFLLSSSGTGVNPGMRSWKKRLSECVRCQEAIGGICFTNKWRAETLQPGTEFDTFKSWLKSGLFKCIPWLKGSIFEGNERRFPKAGFKTYLMTPMSPFNSPTFFCLYLYSLWVLSGGPKIEWLSKNMSPRSFHYDFVLRPCFFFFFSFSQSAKS